MNVATVQVGGLHGTQPGYALTADRLAIRRDWLPAGDRRLLTPVRPTRASAWADAAVPEFLPA